MTSPIQPPGGVHLGFHGPSGTFLHQLLEEARASSTPTVLRDRASPQDKSRPTSITDSSRRGSSVWVGGTTMAQDARDKLRAADEARLRRTAAGSYDGTPDIIRPTLRLHTTPLDTPSWFLPTSSAASSPDDPFHPNPMGGIFNGYDMRTAMSRDADSPRLRPTISGLRLPLFTAFRGQISSAHNSSPPLNSPLIFCDVDSDISATPSPTDPPTSAISATSTSTTTSFDAFFSAPQPSGRRSPGKRAHDRTSSPEILYKKMRTQTLPTTGIQKKARSETHSSWRNSIGGDNRTLIRSSNFTERAPAPARIMTSVEISAFPGLSSFRPQAVGPQGVPSIPATPVRSSTRRTSVVERDESPAPAETPIYARSLQLVDAEVSIYKKDHGDEPSEYPLCLYCFRQHGAFNRINEHGYEACGRDEALASHYWETYGDSVNWSER